jgi:hypothetical protein
MAEPGTRASAGEECRRWAPVLSAMVDGEASAEQVLVADDDEDILSFVVPELEAAGYEVRTASGRTAGAADVAPMSRRSGRRACCNGW